MSFRRIVFFLLLLGGAWWMLAPAPKARWTGRAAPDIPVQSPASLPSAWTQGDFTFTPLARFAVKGVVLSRCNYRSGREGGLCPTDFALGWGVMSDAAVINGMKIWQDHRWVTYQWSERPPAPPAEIAHSLSNMHLIPASEGVRRELARVKRHELLKITGYLVAVHHPDGWRWRSSVSRTDSGGGACEVVWVEHAERASISE